MQTIGERLEEARKRRGATIREASEATKIRGEYLSNFESNNFSISIPEIYVRGFLRSYAGFLKVNPEKIVTDYNAILIGEGKGGRRETREFFGRVELRQPIIDEPLENEAAAAAEPAEKADRPTSLTEILKDYFQNVEKEVILKFGIISALAIILLIALVWTFQAIVSGDSSIATVTQEDELLVESSQPIPITLIARNDVRVTITQEGRLDPVFSGALARDDEAPLEVVGIITVIMSDVTALSIQVGEETYSMPLDRGDQVKLNIPAIVRKQRASRN